MSGYKTDSDLLAQGINCFVRVDLEDESGSNPQIIGFVSEASIRKAINIQRAEVIGQILPVSLDPTGIQVTVSLRGFIPSKRLLDKGISSAGKQGESKIHIKTFNPNDENIIDKQIVSKIPYLDLCDMKGGGEDVIGYSNWLIATGYDDSISGKGYVQANCTLEGIGYENGSAYDK